MRPMNFSLIPTGGFLNRLLRTKKLGVVTSATETPRFISAMTQLIRAGVCFDIGFAAKANVPDQSPRQFAAA